MDRKELLRLNGWPRPGGMSMPMLLSFRWSFNEKTAAKAIKPDCCRRVGLPSCASGDNNANPRRVNARHQGTCL